MSKPSKDTPRPASSEISRMLTPTTSPVVAGIVGGYPVDDHSLPIPYFGRINYDLKETYMFKRDCPCRWFLQFLQRSSLGLLPSFSAGWVMSNELDGKHEKLDMDFLKVRASWGQNGN